MLKVAVITISDRAAKGEYADLSGPRIKEILLKQLPGIDIVCAVVADEKEAIRAELLKNLDRDFPPGTSLPRLAPGFATATFRESVNGCAMNPCGKPLMRFFPVPIAAKKEKPSSSISPGPNAAPSFAQP
jgi:hypothetical protein